ncbi:hypothetical protein [Bacillus piscicola]|uniref:hypothetical protein n=1 Tax=Bacillus piscicola TaxID=1632684 RepID=UPI001F099C76|nr:hypothetical protein [Bacillus piscicola]
MKGIQVIGVTIVVILITLYEWPKLGKQQRKEKTAFVTCTGIVWVLAVILLFFPDMQGPSDWLSALFGPIGESIRK